MKRKARHSQMGEISADCRAIEMCIEAGFDPQKCLRLYGLLSFILLDQKDTPAVFGGEYFDPRSTHPPTTDRERAVRDHLATVLARQQIGEGAYRQAAFRPHCGQCDGDISSVCAGCQKPLCDAHGWAKNAKCISCASRSPSLCIVCRRSARCLRCGVSNTCRYCHSPARRACPRCERSFCSHHAPKNKTATCRGCRNEPAVAASVGLFFVAIVVILIVVLTVTLIVL